ncbi:hypothetical protein EDD22DRAFT_959089 [Suillus occidentalis]|nr:hypothetical protein EDD22DRAFT_959089 [Suillus occidentalis]
MRSAWTTILRIARIRNSIRPSSAQLNSRLKKAIVYIVIGTDDTLAEHAQERGYLNRQGASGGYKEQNVSGGEDDVAGGVGETDGENTEACPTDPDQQLSFSVESMTKMEEQEFTFSASGAFGVDCAFKLALRSKIVSKASAADHAFELALRRKLVIQEQHVPIPYVVVASRLVHSTPNFLLPECAAMLKLKIQIHDQIGQDVIPCAFRTNSDSFNCESPNSCFTLHNAATGSSASLN